MQEQALATRDSRAAEAEELEALRIEVDRLEGELTELREERMRDATEWAALLEGLARERGQGATLLKEAVDLVQDLVAQRVVDRSAVSTLLKPDETEWFQLLENNVEKESLLQSRVNALGDVVTRPLEGWTSFRLPFLHRSVHDQQTLAGFKRAGAVALSLRIEAAVRRIDFHQSENFYPFGPNENYRPECHFDRATGVSAGDAFATAIAHLRAEETAFLIGLAARDHEAADLALAHVLHARQDVASHSNLIDLSGEAAERIRALVMLELDGAPPADFNLTWYDAQEDSPGDPVRGRNDRVDFEHDAYSKDNHFSNDESKQPLAGRTKYEASFDWAVRLTTETLIRLRGKFVDEAPVGEQATRAEIWGRYVAGKRPRR